jgi:XTP/dITP diphosphohydrolase
MRQSNIIVLASNNRHKLEEFQALISKYPPLEVHVAADYLRNSDKLAAVETHSDYAANAAAKARLVNWGCHYPALGDDSGLEVDALSGGPGVRSHRYATAKAGESQDAANIQKLLGELKGRPMEARKARFVCTLVLVMEGIHLTGTGVWEGRIAEAPSGKGGFGYDPVFIPDGFQKTVAELSAEEKNQHSHRAKALNALMAEAAKIGIVFAKP